MKANHDPESYHISTLLNNDRYDVFDSENEINSTESSIDELMYELDDNQAVVIDDITERDGRYENAAAFISEEYESTLDEVTKIEGKNNLYGFIIEDKLWGHAEKKQDIPHGWSAEVPVSTAFIFDSPEEGQYDIKLESDIQTVKIPKNRVGP